MVDVGCLSILGLVILMGLARIIDKGSFVTVLACWIGFCTLIYILQCIKSVLLAKSSNNKDDEE